MREPRMAQAAQVVTGPCTGPGLAVRKPVTA
jgi:hypothetical protein